MGSTGLAGKTLYRGVGGAEHVEDLFNANTPTYMPMGLHGKGLYFTANKQEAYGFADVNKIQGQPTVATVRLNNKAKIITEPELQQALRQAGISVTSDNGDEYMKANGYNVLYSPITGYYVVKDKSVLERK